MQQKTITVTQKYIKNERIKFFIYGTAMATVAGIIAHLLSQNKSKTSINMNYSRGK